MRRRGERGERRGTPADLLVVGLANPGRDYEGTRHNVGAAAVHLLAERHGARLKGLRGVPASVAEVDVAGRRLALAVPSTYMNESGQAARPLVRRFGLEDDLAKLVVIHDELDLPPGRLKVKVGGGLAGNNGLRSIRDHLHTTDFLRIRIGVGKPPSKERGADHVLKRVARSDRELLAVAVDDAAAAVEVIVAEGPEAAMNLVNARPVSQSAGRILALHAVDVAEEDDDDRRAAGLADGSAATRRSFTCSRVASESISLRPKVVDEPLPPTRRRPCRSWPRPAPRRR